MKRFRIWIMWSNVSEMSGRIVDACDPATALERAGLMGDFSGLGTRPSYLGAHAQEMRK